MTLVDWQIAFWVFVALAVLSAIWAVYEILTMPKKDMRTSDAPMFDIKKAGEIDFESHRYDGERPYMRTGSVDRLSAKDMSQLGAA